MDGPFITGFRNEWAVHTPRLGLTAPRPPCIWEIHAVLLHLRLAGLPAFGRHRAAADPGPGGPVILKGFPAHSRQILQDLAPAAGSDGGGGWVGRWRLGKPVVERQGGRNRVRFGGESGGPPGRG